jgi:two-component system nitrate/nitrite response regulator NarL
MNPMTTHHFVTSASARPPVEPTERWREAFPQGVPTPLPALAGASQPGDVVWLAVGFPNVNEVVAALAKAQPQRHVVVVSPVPGDAEGLRAINAGARGYCHAHATPEVLREVAHVVQTGGLWIGPELVERIVSATRALLARSPQAPVEPLDLSALSEREAQVARAVAAGRSNKEVAAQLFISERTVKAHLGAVFEKLGVRDRLQLALRLSRDSRP